MIFQGTLLNLNFDESKFRKTMDAAMETQVRQAARAWLRAVIPLVPVDTGMSRASLRPMSRFLRVAIPISPRRDDPRKSPSRGEAQSKFRFEKNGWNYSFTWSTDVLQFNINNYYTGLGTPPLLHPTPWKATDAGQRAFNAYLAANLEKRLPQFGDFIRTSALDIR